MSITLNNALLRVRMWIKEAPYEIDKNQYTTGTVTVTLSSASVTGSGTAWLTNVKAGDTFFVAGGQYYHILSVDSDTTLTLSKVYAVTGGAGVSYKIRGGQTTDATIVDSLFESEKSLVNIISEFDENYFQTHGHISYVSGTETYTFPATGTFKKILLVRRTDIVKDLNPINLQQRSQYIGTTLSTDSIDEKYYLAGTSTIGIVPVPSTSATDNITIEYIPEAIGFTTGTSTSMIPDSYLELLCLGAAIKHTNDPSVLREYEQRLQEMKQTIGGRQMQESRRVINLNTD